MRARFWPNRAAPVVFALVCVACALGAMCLAPVRAEAASHFNRGNDAEPETLDPHKSSTLAEAHIIRDLYEGLIINDEAGELKPGVAERWTVSSDGLTYIFYLRSDARWSNGDQVKADDFVFSLRRLLDPATAAEYANVLYPLRHAEAINTGKMPITALGVAARDTLVLEMTLESPTPYFLELLAHQTTAPVHPPSLAGHGQAFVKAGQLVSNGAYTLSQLVPGSHVRLTKNARYHSVASTMIDSVDYILVKDLAAGVRRFKAGELDLLPDIPTDQLKDLRLTFGKQLMVAPLQGTIYLAFNTVKAPFSDARVRQALAMAIDRDFLAEDIANGTILAADRFVPPGAAFAGCAPAAAPWLGLSIIEREDEAKKLLAHAGFNSAKPLTVEFRYNANDNNKAMAVAIADMWKRIGVITRFIATDSRTHFAYLREKGDYDVARAGWVADYNDPQNFLFLLESGSGLNFMSWSHPPFDQVMRQAGSELDVAKRSALLLAAENMVLDQTPLTPIAYYTGRYLVSDKLKGWIPNLRAANATRFLSLQK